MEKQIRYLQASPDKARAFAGALGKSPEELPAYLRSMTSVQLLVDTWVTNHGYLDGKATSYQAVLQAGTAVLVDAQGVPRVRCACGNPLTPPTATGKGLKTRGKPWSGFRDSNVVTVQPAPKPVRTFVLQDPRTGDYFARPEGTDGSTDQPSPAPSASPFSPSPSSPNPRFVGDLAVPGRRYDARVAVGSRVDARADDGRAHHPELPGTRGPRRRSSPEAPGRPAGRPGPPRPRPRPAAAAPADGYSPRTRVALTRRLRHRYRTVS
ncbi:hypothetical protein O1L44_06605 [Streptomyces noursei]|nr:hypothetical protein [Streptomyces noursei]